MVGRELAHARVQVLLYFGAHAHCTSHAMLLPCAVLCADFLALALLRWRLLSDIIEGELNLRL